MRHCITVLPPKQNIVAADGDNLLDVLRASGFGPDAPCGGNGRCGKCTVLVDGREALACQMVISRDMVVTIPEAKEQKILTQTMIADGAGEPGKDGYLLAFDIGTTTVVGYLLDGHSGRELACESTLNPQVAFGADVISRIQHARDGGMEALTAAIRSCVEALAATLCIKADVQPGQVSTVSMVGNPAMQQFFLGIQPDNLAQIPFAPVLTKAETAAASGYLPALENAQMLIVPDISGFVGADIVAGILATGMAWQEELTLLVDIGTNGEMVLGNKDRMVACATAAGPALEGANIGFGMCARTGAMDHVWLENGEVRYSTIGGEEAVGICGSGLIDAVAAALDLGLLNERGRVQTEDRRIHLTDRVWMDQDDIRHVQAAKGAIAAGIEQLAAHLGVSLQDIRRVYLAGAFGTYMRAEAACRIGLLPTQLEGKIQAVGNAAGSGAKLLAANEAVFRQTGQLLSQIESLELARVAGFQRSFAQNMRFANKEQYWIEKALAMGFSHGVPLHPAALQPRQDVRDMCRGDQCGAYGKNWTCPPHCGSLAECQAQIRQYDHGILLQTVGKTEKLIDTKAYRRIEQEHLERFYRLAAQIRRAFPHALCLGSGGCRICPVCAYPQPCRLPEQACASMEGYGLFVTQVCRDNGLAYHYGEKTITYTACILF